LRGLPAKGVIEAISMHRACTAIQTAAAFGLAVTVILVFHAFGRVASLMGYPRAMAGGVSMAFRPKAIFQTIAPGLLVAAWLRLS